MSDQTTNNADDTPVTGEGIPEGMTVGDLVGQPDVERLPLREWMDYSDAEILGRMLRRGADPVMTKGCLQTKHLDESQAYLSEYLDQEYLDDRGEPIKFETPLDRRPRR